MYSHAMSPKVEEETPHRRHENLFATLKGSDIVANLPHSRRSLANQSSNLKVSTSYSQQ